MDKMYKNTWFAIAVVLIVAIGVYAYVETKPDQIVVVNTDKTVVTNDDDKKTAPVNSDWSVYRSPEFGYEFQYPNKWDFNTKTPDDPHLSNIPTPSGFYDTYGDYAEVPGQVTIEFGLNGAKPANVDLLTHLRNTSNTEGGLGHTCPCSNVTVNGVSIIKMANHGGEGPFGPGYAIENPNDKTKYVHVFVYGNYDVETVNKIISSFKFTK